jgi:hypothetical protein
VRGLGEAPRPEKSLNPRQCHILRHAPD